VWDEDATRKLLPWNLGHKECIDVRVYTCTHDCVHFRPVIKCVYNFMAGRLVRILNGGIFGQKFGVTPNYFSGESSV